MAPRAHARRHRTAQGARARPLFAGQTVSLIGDDLAPMALAFAVLEEGGSATNVGIVYASNIVARLAFILVGGVMADRLSRHRVMLAADALGRSARACSPSQ